MGWLGSLVAAFWGEGGSSFGSFPFCAFGKKVCAHLHIISSSLICIGLRPEPLLIVCASSYSQQPARYTLFPACFRPLLIGLDLRA